MILQEVEVPVDMQAPFFIIGAPRSGTTYLTQALNVHSRIFVTNETRVMAFMNRALRQLGTDKAALSLHRDEFLDVLRANAADMVRSFYDRLGAQADARWGDKHPHYADPKTDPGCLQLIDEVFPTSQFIHIVRDGRDVVSSIAGRAWVEFEEALDVWNRCVTNARDFGLQIGLDRYLEIHYEHLVSDAKHVVDGTLRFLGLKPTRSVHAFLDQQSRARTPFSGPVTQAHRIGSSTWRTRLKGDQLERANLTLADRLVEFGYETYEWRRALVTEPTADTVGSSSSSSSPSNAAKTAAVRSASRSAS